MTTITIAGTVYSETNEYPNRTDLSNAAVATTAPETLSIAQSWNRKAFGKRAMTATFAKHLPHVTVNGGTFVEVISLALKLTHIPDYLSTDKSSAIGVLFTRMGLLSGNNDFQANMIAGVHNADYTISAS